MYMRVYMNMYICIYVYMYKCMYMRVYMNMYIYMCIYIYTFTSVYNDHSPWELYINILESKPFLPNPPKAQTSPPFSDLTSA